MASDLWNIFLNVVAAFVYAGIVWLWQNKGSRPMSPPPRPVPLPEGGDAPLDRRALNRQALERAAHRFLFYFVTFGVLYLSVTMPPLFKALFAKHEVLLSNARFIGESLPPVPVSKDYLQVTFFLLAAVLYWPLLFLAEGCVPPVPNHRLLPPRHGESLVCGLDVGIPALVHSCRVNLNLAFLMKSLFRRHSSRSSARCFWPLSLGRRRQGASEI